jgi:uncharacterized protein
VSPELQRLIQLQDIDVRIFDLTDRLHAIPNERQHIEQRFRQEAAEYFDLEQSLDRIRQERARIDADLAEHERSHEKFKGDLMKVRNQKEYGTIIREIDVTKKTISALETEALQLMDKVEQTEKQIAERAPEFEKHRGEVDQSLAALDREAEAVEAEIAELRARRQGIASEVAPQYLSTYDRIARNRKGRAMSEVRKELRGGAKCSACNVTLRPQAFADVRRGETLIVCDSCARILFYRPEREAPAEAGAS